jgi:hypothetical protein
MLIAAGRRQLDISTGKLPLELPGR